MPDGRIWEDNATISLGGALAEHGHDVLLIDGDPQGTLTEGTGFADAYHADGVTLFETLTDIDRQDAVNDLITPHTEFDVIPAHEQMFGVERELQTSPRTEQRLDGMLDALDRSYDYILIDTPPHLGPLANNALVAADGVVVPAKAVRRSVRALETLFEQVNVIEKHFSAVKRFGMVVNDVAYPTDNDTEEMLEWFTRFADDIGVYEIRNRVAIKRAWNNGVSIFAHDEDCDMTDEYRRLAADITRRPGVTNNGRRRPR